MMTTLSPEQMRKIERALRAGAVIVAIYRPEGYDDVHPELVAGDALDKGGTEGPFEYEVIAAGWEDSHEQR